MQPVVSDKPTKSDGVGKKKKGRMTAEKYESQHGNFVPKGSVGKESKEDYDQEVELSDEEVK